MSATTPAMAPGQTGPGANVVRELELHRRRSRIPWVYLVYHRRTRLPCRPEPSSRPPASARASGLRSGPPHEQVPTLPFE
jgi:hypothetical protein